MLVLLVYNFSFFHLYNELRHTHKQEMELLTHDCTSSCFCHLFTDPCQGKTYFFLSELYLVLFYTTLFYFILFHFILSIFLLQFFSLYTILLCFLINYILPILSNSIQWLSVAYLSSAFHYFSLQGRLLPEGNRLQRWHSCLYTYSIPDRVVGTVYIVCTHLLYTDCDCTVVV